MRLFLDRREAGRELGAALAETDWAAPVVIGLARGGIPVAYEVARILGAPLRIQVVRKIGAPGDSEFGVGAVTADGPPVFDDRSLATLGLRRADLAEECARKREEARSRVARYGRTTIPVTGRDVIVTDDGLATGVSARAALRAVRLEHPRLLVFAAPVASPDSADALLAEADEVRCLLRPDGFRSVGQFYLDFRQTGDDEVLELTR